MKIHIQIPDSNKYPYKHIKQGIENLGWDLVPYNTHNPDPEINVISWSIWPNSYREKLVLSHESVGGHVYVMENSWLPSKNKVYWQLAKKEPGSTGFNGQGTIKFGTKNRWSLMSQELKPWKSGGDYILVCAQRGVVNNAESISHGPLWPKNIFSSLKKTSKLPVFIRPHPEARRSLQSIGDSFILDSSVPLQEHLENAAACVVYSSTAATEAVLSGVPTMYQGQSIMCKDLAHKYSGTVELVKPDREPVLNKLAYANWSNDELSSGEALKWVLG